MYSAHAKAPLHVIFPEWGIYVLESHHSSDFHMPATRHDYLKLILVLEGEGQVSFTDSSLPLERGDLLFIPQEQEHHLSDSPSKPLALLVLCIQPKVWINLHIESADLDHQSVLKPVGNEVRSLFRGLFFEQSLLKPHCDLMMTGLCYQLFALVKRLQHHPAEHLQQVYDAKSLASTRVQSYSDYLQSHFNLDESLGDVAARLGISRRYFSLLFKEYVGESWLSYVRNLRIAYAKELLLSTDRSVTTITFECGFNDLSNFYRCFKKLTGSSPERWRQAQRQAPQQSVT